MVDYWIKCKKKKEKRKCDVICNVAIICENEYVIKTCTCLIKSMTKDGCLMCYCWLNIEHLSLSILEERFLLGCSFLGFSRLHLKISFFLVKCFLFQVVDHSIEGCTGCKTQRQQGLIKINCIILALKVPVQHVVVLVVFTCLCVTLNVLSFSY